MERVKSERSERFNYQGLKDAFFVFLRFKKYALRFWKLELILLSISAALLLPSLAAPYLGKLVMDEGILSRNLTAFLRYTLIAAAFYLFQFFFSSLQGYLRNYTVRKIGVRLSGAALARIKKLPLRLFRQKSSGEYIFRLNSDIESCAGIITNTLPQILTVILRLVCVSVIIIWIDYRIMVLIAAYQLIVALNIRFFHPRLKRLMQEGVLNAQEKIKALSQIFSNIYFFKSIGATGLGLRRYFGVFSKGVRIRVKSARMTLFSSLLSGVYNKIFFGGASFFGSIMVINGRITLGSLGAILGYLGMGAVAYSALLESCKVLMQNSIYLDRLVEILEADFQPEGVEGAIAPAPLKDKIEFNDVFFSYAPGKYVFEGMSFSLPAGARIALAGSSGCGKTTILNLILRLYDVNKGAVLFDGNDLRSLKFKPFYAQFGVALQEPFLFNESVSDNICFGIKKPPMHEIVRAAQIAMADDFIENLPCGYDTVVGEGACNLSQGQKQRLAIARAVMRRPRILILDEAMSSLDSETEDKIIENISRQLKDSMLIMVSHRFSTVKKMDLIYFIQGAGEIDCGRHEEIFLTNPKYKELFASQIEVGEESPEAQAIEGAGY